MCDNVYHSMYMRPYLKVEGGYDVSCVPREVDGGVNAGGGGHEARG